MLQVLFCKVLEKWSKLTTRACGWQSPCVMTQLSAVVYHEKSEPAKKWEKKTATNEDKVEVFIALWEHKQILSSDLTVQFFKSV